MSVEIMYNGTTIASASTDITKTLLTGGKYCDGDIEVINTQGGRDDTWTLIGVSAVGTIDAFMRAHPIPIPQDGFKMLMLKITGLNAQTMGSTTVLQYLFPFFNGQPWWYDIAATKMQNFACIKSGIITPDNISTTGTWSIRNNDLHTIVDGELHWTTQTTFYMGVGNSIFYKWVDWR